MSKENNIHDQHNAAKNRGASTQLPTPWRRFAEHLGRLIGKAIHGANLPVKNNSL